MDQTNIYYHVDIYSLKQMSNLTSIKI